MGYANKIEELIAERDRLREALRSALLVMRGEALPLKRHAIQQAEEVLATDSPPPEGRARKEG